eukprot:8950360-Lingulodinium_polyedra.AAC.1
MTEEQIRGPRHRNESKRLGRQPPHATPSLVARSPYFMELPTTSCPVENSDVVRGKCLPKYGVNLTTKRKATRIRL